MATRGRGTGPKRRGPAYDRVRMHTQKYNAAVKRYNAAYRKDGKLSERPTPAGVAAKKRLTRIYDAVALEGARLQKAIESWYRS